MKWFWVIAIFVLIDAFFGAAALYAVRKRREKANRRIITRLIIPISERRNREAKGA